MSDSDVTSADRAAAGSKVAWVVVIVLVAVGAYALRVSFVRYGDGILSELTRGEVTKRPTVFGKIRRDGGRQYLWAKGPKVPSDDQSEWFDMTGSPLKLEAVNHGIGRDTIPAINDPVFVEPDDPRFIERWARPGTTNVNMLRVIGVALNGVAKAYPLSLMNHHELVNDTFGGKPVTVGW